MTHIKFIITAIIAALTVSCNSKKDIVNNNNDSSLPRVATPDAMTVAMDSLWDKANADNTELHSVMVVKDGNVIYEEWRNGAHPDSAHALYSVSKTFTALGVGLAIQDGLLSLDERIIDLFPGCLPDSVSDNLAAMTVEHLLTMSGGYAHAPELYTDIISAASADSSLCWAREILKHPVEYKPGTVFSYNSMGSYLLSAAIQRRSGQKLIDYLNERIFTPLGIKNAVWEENAEGINVGGWGLMLKTEDLAKAGQLMLNRGSWHGHSIVPAEWIDRMSSRHIQSVQGTPNSIEASPTHDDMIHSDWVQGYGYQLWRCRHNAYRADGSLGQFIVVIPDENAVVAMTANSHNYQKEINLVWDFILPTLKAIDDQK